MAENPGTPRPAWRARVAWARVAGGAVVTAAALIWVFGRVERPAEVIGWAARCRWGWLAAALLLRVGLIPVKNVRWRVVLRALSGGRVGPTWTPLVLGYFASCFLPLRGGELVRVQLAAAPTRLSRAALLSTVVAERAIDGVVLCGLLWAASTGVEAPAWVGPTLRRIVLVFGMGIAVLFLLSFRTGWGKRYETTRFGFLLGLFRRFREGVAIFRRRPWLLPVVGGITAAVWCLEGLATFWVLEAFGIGGGYAAGLFLTAAVTLALTVPTAPGNLGPHQAIYVAFLGYQGAPSESALAASLVSQAGITMILLVMGGAVLLSGRVRWGDVRGLPRQGAATG